MAKVQIRIRDKGPYLVTGDVELVDAEGNRYAVEKSFALCRCGLSQKKPFCDGSHRGRFDDAPRAKEVL